MPEPDEIDRLRAADPVEPASLPSATDPGPRALFERITMTPATRTPPAGAALSTTPPSPRRRPLLVGAAAAALAAVLAAGGWALTRDGGSERPAGNDAATGPISPGGPSTGSCVELYGLDTLPHRELAFEGTVTAVEGDAVTFTVGRWFRGDRTPEVTLQGAEGLSGLTSAGAGAGVGVGLRPGTRLLVAGDGGFAWSCGFTQPYDEAVARQWAEVLR
ncbi:MAG TPA: hypothetical protein VFO65_14765 [Acidimicrobiales bacterium]|nr:hypothetical protein [Acidimicrobiales bacterium]